MYLKNCILRIIITFYFTFNTIFLNTFRNSIWKYSEIKLCYTRANDFLDILFSQIFYGIHFLVYYVLFIIPKIYCKNFFHQKLRGIMYALVSNPFNQEKLDGNAMWIKELRLHTHGECAHARVVEKKWSNFQVSTITRNMRNIKRHVHAGNLAGMSNASSSTLA